MSRQTEYSRETLHYISKYKNLNAVIHAGDLSYADFVQERWDSWGEMIQPVAARVPWMVAPGNHEIEPTMGFHTFLAYQSRFHMPSSQSRSNAGNLYYSFDIGMVHFIILTPYSLSMKHSPQYQRLIQDLVKVDRDVTPWIFVVMHGPWYNSNRAHQNILEPQHRMKYNMEDLLYQHRVDAVFAGTPSIHDTISILGHVHAYERTHPVYQGEMNAQAPHYIVVGDAGNREGLAKEFLMPKPKWSAFRRGRYGYGYLVVQNETDARFEWHEDDKTTSDCVDSVWIHRERI